MERSEVVVKPAGVRMGGAQCKTGSGYLTYIVGK